LLWLVYSKLAGFAAAEAKAEAKAEAEAEVEAEAEAGAEAEAEAEAGAGAGAGAEAGAEAEPFGQVKYKGVGALFQPRLTEINRTHASVKCHKMSARVGSTSSLTSAFCFNRN